VLGNDVDPEGNAMTVANLTQPAAGTGTAVLLANQTVTYTPPAGFAGTASFTYQARDSFGALSNVATVTVTVNANVVLVDIDIQQFSVSVRGRTPNAVATPTVRVRNGGNTTLPAGRSIPVNVSANVPGGAYNQTLNVTGPLAPGASVTLNFQPRTITAPTSISWTATVTDDNPDADVQTVITTIR
jgi:hypothetical protein